MPKTSKFKPHRPSRPYGPDQAQSTSNEEVDHPASSTDDTSTIPSELLITLLHQSFEDDRTRMSTDAAALVGKYMELFVKEALARATLERAESSGSRDKFLEVRLAYL